MKTIEHSERFWAKTISRMGSQSRDRTATFLTSLCIMVRGVGFEPQFTGKS